MRARKRRGWSQTRLAAELGRLVRWVRLLESGELPWVRRIEDGRTPAAHDLRVLTQLAEVLDLELAELMRAPDVVAPAAISMAAQVGAPAPQFTDVPTVSSSERPASPARGRPLRAPARTLARLSPARARMLDAMASPLVLIGAATVAVGVVAASAAAGVLPTSSHRSVVLATQIPRVALHPAASASGGSAAPAVPEAGPVLPPAVATALPAPQVPTAPEPVVAVLPPGAPTAVRLPAARAAAPVARPGHPEARRPLSMRRWSTLGRSVPDRWCLAR